MNVHKIVWQEGMLLRRSTCNTTTATTTTR